MRFSFLLAIFLVGCASAPKNLELVEGRTAKLITLSAWEPVMCRLEVTPTQSARARFEQMFPKVKIEEPWVYTWKAREVACEVHPHKSNAMTEGQKSFLETAFCVLLQTHFVNSPFDELKYSPEAIVGDKEYVQIKTSESAEVGIFLPRERFTVETRTRAHGVFSVDYTEQNGRYLPARLESKQGEAFLRVDELTFGAGSVRQNLEAFWIFIGAEQALRHSHVKISECKPY